MGTEIVETRENGTLTPIAPDALNEQTVLLQVIARAAGDQTVDLERMERLLGMHERLVAKQAERDFIEAMARFKEKAPKIIKDRQVRIPTEKGVIEYKHASLGAVVDAAIAGLGAVGISHRWDLDRKDGRIHVTCVLTHLGGHSTRTTLDGAPDDSGKKNGIQQTASTITYLERYTLLAATGLATEEDDDGGGADNELDRITEKQAADLHALITEEGGDIGKALRFLKLSSLAEIPAKNYDAVVAQIKSINAAKARARSAT